MRKAFFVRFVFAAVAAGTVLNASATTLVNGQSHVNLIDDGAGAGAAVDWFIGQGPDNLFEQDYWFRVGNAGAMSRVGTLGAPTISQPTDDLVTYTFQGPGFELSVRYLLTGDHITADLAEQVRIHNFSDAPLVFSLLEYDDFDLAGTAGGDTLVRLNSSTMTQSDGGTSVTVGATPIPDHFEMGNWPSVLNDFTSATFVNLNDVDLSPLSGDDTFAYQWNVVINPNSSFIASKDKVLTVPEPASMAVLGLGAVGLFVRRRRSR